MTDRPLDEGAFERALRATLDDLAPAATPSTLRAFVADVPLRSRRGPVDRNRTLFTVVGLAVAVVLAVGGVGLLAGERGLPGGVGQFATPSVSPTPGPTTFTFRVVPADGSTASKAQVDAVSEVFAARLRAYQIGNFTSYASDDRITVELDLPSDAGARDAVRRLLGTTGAFTINEPTTTEASVGERVEGPPLLTREEVTAATVGSDQPGSPTLDLTLNPAGAASLANATTGHVGDFMAVVLDGVAVAVPVIRAPITGGQLQLQFDDQDKESAALLAAMLQSGPLPLAVQEVAP